MQYHEFLNPLTEIIDDIRITIVTHDFKKETIEYLGYNNSSLDGFGTGTEGSSIDYYNLISILQNRLIDVQENLRSFSFEQGDAAIQELKKVNLSCNRLIEKLNHPHYREGLVFKMHDSLKPRLNATYKEELTKVLQLLHSSLMTTNQLIQRLIKQSIDQPAIISKTKKLEKIKYNGNAASFGYLMLEMAKQGLIDVPTSKGDLSFTALAKLCFQYFDIKATEGTLVKELNENSNKLSETKRAKFTIPSLSELK